MNRLLDAFLFEAMHSLIDQSMCSHSAETPTNGDGFGIGWYGTRPNPGLFRSIPPAWNDFNLRDLASQIESPLFLAHVRATSQATVQETNCHPFRYRNWLFVHNGEIFEIEKLRRDLLTTLRKQRVTIYVDKPSQQWIVCDQEGNFWIVPVIEEAWEHRQPFTPTGESEPEPVPEHYKYMLGLPF